MFRFFVVLATVAICNAGHLPVSYSSVTLHPVHTVKVVHPEWKAPEWKAPTEWKPAEWKTPEWKAPEWKAPTEWKPAEWKAAEWQAPEWKPTEWKEPEWKTVEWKEPEKPANYDFKYEVHDEHTGDIKRQSETAVNGAVKGQYSLIDSDGYRRVVDYTADDHHGFQATVKREPTHYKIPTPVKVVSHEQQWW